MKKISIIGAGRVGETTALLIAQQGLCREIALLDVREGAAAGAALDIMQAAAYFGFDTQVDGMRYAVIARSPILNGRAKSFDDAAARKVNGVLDVFTNDTLNGAPVVPAEVTLTETIDAACLRLGTIGANRGKRRQLAGRF